ncbi:hypothetical protein M1555_04400, partial [Patescibacteria group bacterium]|nr:hypothetical protein [Patescibacteria group bacterium]
MLGLDQLPVRIHRLLRKRRVAMRFRRLYRYGNLPFRHLSFWTRLKICCRNPNLMDKILREILNYLLPEEP